jgi:hypothetical protein
MAVIFEESVTIKLSTLIKDGGSAETSITEELIASLEAVAQELVGNKVIVEVESN